MLNLVLSSLASGLLIASAVTEPAFTQSSPSARSRPPALVTMEGCLYKEVDVPGRHVPDAMRSRTVTDEDYVLARFKVIKGSAPPPAVRPDATPTDSSAPPEAMYKVKASHLKLGEHAGQRVQVDGSFDHQDRSGKPVSFANDLVIMNGTAIREVPGDCPKTTAK